MVVSDARGKSAVDPAHSERIPREPSSAMCAVQLDRRPHASLLSTRILKVLPRYPHPGIGSAETPTLRDLSLRRRFGRGQDVSTTPRICRTLSRRPAHCNARLDPAPPPPVPPPPPPKPPAAPPYATPSPPEETASTSAANAGAFFRGTSNARDPKAPPCQSANTVPRKSRANSCSGTFRMTCPLS